ncbi:cardiolipin synthase [Gimesia panareensis]|uniref:cardiolipin synthase n=1 Tax=Gimesia panareensis TaxID=2527978 RepID=UPI00118BD760|nr:cardiolipin synthase [Gimesia panareensis]QDU51003.1 Major cardiolipin synthase ClsA [Gimesia panareensis]
MDWITAAVTISGYLITLALIPHILLQKKRHPVSTVSWILCILLLPGLGGIIYLFFGINRVQRRSLSKERANQSLAPKLPQVIQNQLLSNDEYLVVNQNLMRLAQNIAHTVPTYGNSLELLTDTNRTLGLIKQAIMNARHSLHLEYYIWQPDQSGTMMRDLLIEKAKAGVEVRFLYDGLGSMYLRRRFFKPMIEAGIQVAPFLPGATFRERWSLNLRNHRKIVIVDGNLAFTGGMNIGDEYLGLHQDLGFWRDTHLKIEGPETLQLQQVFAEDWFFATGEALTHSQYYPHPETDGNVTAQTLCSGPEKNADVFLTLMFAAINEARESLLLTTSYFVPPESLTTALESAARRGVHVKLLVSGKSANPSTVHAGRSYYDSLLDAGVEIYEYNKGILHSKTLTIDDCWSLVGTANFDFRSLILNFEVGLAIYDRKFAQRLRETTEQDILDARKITEEEWEQRGKLVILKQNIYRLFAPVM